MNGIRLAILAGRHFNLFLRCLNLMFSDFEKNLNK